MTVPTISQNAPYVWAVLGASNVGIPTIAQDAPYVWTLTADANGNAITENYFYNILDYGAIYGDNNTNKVVNTTAINNALAAAVAAGGGVIFFPPGTIRSKNVDFHTASNVIFMGCGPGVSIWKLADSENTDLLSAYTSSISIGAASGSGSSTGITFFGIRDMTLDGNKAGQASGTSYPLRFYGYGYFLHNIQVKNGYSGGIQCDYNGAFPSNRILEAKWTNIDVFDCNGICIEIGGPTDCQWQNVLGFFAGTHCIHIGPNAAGLQALNCHPYSAGLTDKSGLAWLIEGSCHMAGCEAEGSYTAQVGLLANNVTWHGGRIFADTPHASGAGLQIGQVATATLKTGAVASPITLTTAPATVGYACYLQFVITGAGASGTIPIIGTDVNGNAASETLAPTGNGTFTSTNAYATVTSITVTGLAGFSIVVNGLPAAYPGSVNASAGVATLVSPSNYDFDTAFYSIAGTNGSLWYVSDGKGSVKAVVNQTSSTGQSGTVSAKSNLLLWVNGLTPDNSIGKGGTFQIYPDSSFGFKVSNGTHDVFNINVSSGSQPVQLPNASQIWMYQDNYATLGLRLANNTICPYPSSSVAATATNGTITTSGVGIARVNPAGNITGVILQAGTIQGQMCMVSNKSAFTVTFAVAGTSNVADGTSDVIAATRGAIFEWDATDSLWYRCG